MPNKITCEHGISPKRECAKCQQRYSDKSYRKFREQTGFITKRHKNWKRFYLKNRERLIREKRQWAKDNPEKMRQYRKRGNDKVRLIVLTHYSGNPPKCQCKGCNESNIRFLTIDHVSGGGVKHRKKIGKGTTIYRWLIHNNFPEGFQVLCWNCNCGRAYNGGICPHEEVSQ